ncbi:hypothetical protein PybrP1_006384 [[Pythium] brassicae (nom. inval.)]|nr:hypothetical protein PybrP1_006384 [[Pythium] brassicae (nom. inval.)]
MLHSRLVRGSAPQLLARGRRFLSGGGSGAASHAWEPIERKWQERWAASASASASAPRTAPNGAFYCLAMFPYPSGQLHIGHVRVYTISDCISRLKRMQGYDVLHPMGWDAFGLPAENAAIERGISPADWTVHNIAQAKRQLQALGIQIDWDREVTTCSPDYYKWTQALFLKLFDKGLAYRKEALVNWDPVDKTVLANEQVDAEGKSWRSGALVEQRSLNQWFLRITDYGDRLLDDLDKACKALLCLTKWPESVKRMQAAWIGRSTGSKVNFKVALDAPASPEIPLTVFTTRVDTIFGVSFVSVAPESAVVDDMLQHIPASRAADVCAYVARVKALTKDDRTKGDTTSGVFTGLYAVHPLTFNKVPIFLAEYVLPHYGTGVVMGVPAHDSRDIEFARHHALEILHVVDADAAVGTPDNDDSGVVTGYGAAINATLAREGVGGAFTQFRLRDWLVSRQRYWGTPVPIVHCASCGPVGVPVQDLPVELPALGAIAADLKGGDGESPLARMTHWKQCACPQCGGPAERDTDTLDTFVDSSWYFLRYCDAQNQRELFAPSLAAKWLQRAGADVYVGGIEHAILHLLYARFITKFLFDEQLLAADEPFAQLLAQGMVLGRTHKSPTSLRCLQPGEYAVGADGRVTEMSSGREVVTVWEKMSKSKYNGVDPEGIRRQHGADVTRLVVLFKAPPAHELEWDEADLAGQSRWLSRVWGLVDAAATGAPTDAVVVVDAPAEAALRLALHSAIKRVTEALDQHQSFNVAIAELMKLSNVLGEQQAALSATAAFRESVERLVQMLAPLAPHTSAEMFEQLAGAGADVHASAWPQFDEALLASAHVKIVLQVGGKPRDTIFVAPERQGDREHVLALAMASSTVQRHLQGKSVRKALLVPPKKQGAHGLLNIVAA